MPDDSFAQTMETILSDYRFGQEDMQKLQELQELFKEHIDAILPEFYEFILSFRHARAFLKNEEILQRHREGIGRWFMALTSGRYDLEYFRWLESISEVHVHIGLPPHYVNAAFGRVRELLGEMLRANGREDSINALNKILDINLDILSQTYHQQEQQNTIEETLVLRRALRAEKIFPYLQPIVDAKDGSVCFYECLMRIFDPQTGEIYSIATLHDTAKKTHLYHYLTYQMLERSMEIFLSREESFSLNLDYEDIVDEEFRAFLRKKILEFPAPERIIFELVETEMVGDYALLYDFAEEMRSYGCRIALDDFGSGYSNLDNLLHLHPDFIKIDGAIIKKILEIPENRALMRSVIEMARNFDARIVAEYVANREILLQVKEAGVDCVQGYYFAIPAPAEEFLDMEKQQG